MHFIRSPQMLILRLVAHDHLTVALVAWLSLLHEFKALCCKLQKQFDINTIFRLPIEKWNWKIGTGYVQLVRKTVRISIRLNIVPNILGNILSYIICSTDVNPFAIFH